MFLPVRVAAASEGSLLNGLLNGRGSNMGLLRHHVQGLQEVSASGVAVCGCDIDDDGKEVSSVFFLSLSLRLCSPAIPLVKCRKSTF
jgi:hypothetical protein